MEERVIQELDLLRMHFPELEYHEDDRWIRLLGFRLPSGWSVDETDVAFPIKIGYPGEQPYGIYVPGGLRFQGHQPSNYTEPASPQPPFDGTWGLFSWSPEPGQWRPTADLVSGSNLLNWVFTFADRFKQGA